MIFSQILLTLKNFETFGKLITTLWFIIRETLDFGVIFSIILLYQSFVMYIFFNDLKNKRLGTLLDSIYYLIETMFG